MYCFERLIKFPLKFFCGLALIFLFSSCSHYKLFQEGEAILTEKVEVLPVDYTFQLPIVQVEINGKTYSFLVDTGAPTVISHEIFEELGLKAKRSRTVSDSQNQKHKQIFTSIPEIKVGNIVFKDIGATVMDWSDNAALSCRKVEGIIGANQMKSATWKFNYQEKTIMVSKDITLFDTAQYTYQIPFYHHMQKTPLIDMKMGDESFTLIFDTGSNGNIKLKKTPKALEKISADKKIEEYGGSSIGIYGLGETKTNYIFQMDTIEIGNLQLEKPILATGNSSTIGNEILENYEFILDWNQNKIYLKRIKEAKKGMESFGYGFFFQEQTPIVTYVFKGKDIPLEIGDTILSINGRNYEDLDDQKVCEYITSKFQEDHDQKTIKVLRKGEILEFTIPKKRYFE